MVRRSWRLGAVLFLISWAQVGCGSPPSAPLYFDDPSPAVPVAHTPADGAVQVPPDVVVQVELSRAIDANRLDEAVITFQDAGAAVPFQAPLYQLRLLTIQPDQLLAQGQQHTVTIAGLYDTVGRPVNTITWTFSTLTDADPPQLVFNGPKALAPVSASTQITAQFDEDLDADLVSPDWIVVEDITGTPVTVAGSLRYEALSRALIFRPDAALTVGATISVALSDKIVDRFGNAYAGPLPGFQFDVALPVDTKAPVFTGGAPTAQYLPPDRVRVEWPSGSDDDPTAELRYEVRAQGVAFPPAGQVVAIAYGQQTIDVVGLPFGSYRFIVSTVDHSGNRREYPCPAPTPGGPTCPPVAFSQLGGVDFAQQVRPLLQNTCGQPLCHLGQDAPGFVDMSQDAVYQDIVEHVDHVSQLRLVVPFEPDLSYLYWKIGNEARFIAGEDPFPIAGSFMPPEQIGPLPYSDVELIRRWIEQGATEEISPP